MNFPRFLSGFVEISDTVWLQSARLSGIIQPIGSRGVDIGLQTNPFRSVFANTFSNLNGILQVNQVVPSLPITVSTTSGISKVGLLFDNTLQLDSMGRLGVKSMISTPSGDFTFDAPLFFDSANSNVSLLYNTDNFKVDDNKLTLIPDLWKPRGGLKLSGSVADAIADIGQLMDFSDLSLPSTPVHLKILQLKTSDDFTQTNGQLEMKAKTAGCIPFYKTGNGFAVNSNFNYDDVTLSVRFVKIENSFELQDNYASSVGYVNQAYQSSDNTAIDITSPQNGRRIISVRTDNTTIKIDSSTNKLISAVSYNEPLSITNGQVSIGVDGSTIVKSGNMLKGGYTAGRGIVINGNSIGTDEALDLTFEFPLIKTGEIVRLDMSGIDPISVNDLTGKISLSIDSTLTVEAGKLSVVPKQLNGGDGILIADDQISFLGDLHHFDFVDTQAKLRLKPGGLISSDMEGLFVSLQGENGILYENGIIRLLFNLSHFQLSAGDELELNLSNIFTASQTEGLDIRVDNVTIKKDSVTGLKGGYVAKAGSAISVTGNEIGENITCSNGVRRTGNVIEGSYTGSGIIFVSGSTIGIREEDLDQRIKDRTGISQPSDGGGGSGGGNPFSDLSNGLSSVGSILGGSGAGAVFGGISGGLAGGAVGGSTGLTSSGITSGVAAGVSLGGAAVSIGSTLSHGFGYGSQGLSAGNLADDQGGWGFSLGNATLLYPDVYTDKTKSVCAIGYLKGSSNTTIIDSTSPTTGTLVVLGGLGIYKNLHVGGDLYTGDIALQYNTLFLGNNNDPNHYIGHGMSNTASTNYNIDGVVVQGGVGGGILGQGGTIALRWLNNVVTIPGRLDVGGSIYSGLDKVATERFVADSIALYGYSKTVSDAKYMPITYQPDLSGYYSRDEINILISPLVARQYVYTKVEADQRFKPIGYQPDLSAYCLKTALDDYLPWQVALDFYAQKDSVYTISQADQTFVSKTFFDDFTLGVYSRDMADATFAKQGDVYTKGQADARYMPIMYSPPAPPDLSPYLLKTTADSLYKPIGWTPDLSSYLTTLAASTLYKPIGWTPDLSAYALKSDLNFVQPSALTSYFTKTESDARFVHVGSPIVFPTNVGQDSSDGKRRFYFADNDRTYYYSPNGYEWRNADDSSPILRLNNDGSLLTNNVALEYNTLFLALNADQNHFISHGMSNVAFPNYNLDGVVVQGGVGGGALGQSGTTALRWLNGLVSIPGSLKVSGATNLNDISVLPRNGNDTNPAFQVEAYGHDNVSCYFDAYYNGSALVPSHSSYFRISKYNGNLWIGGGNGDISNLANFVQISPTGQVTLTSNNALTVTGDIYTNGNKVATEAAATTIATNLVNANKSWESRSTFELNVNGNTDTPCYIDFHSAATVSDYNLRILRNAGVNGSGLIEQLGTSPLTIQAPQVPQLSLSSTDNPVATGGSVIFGSSVRHDAPVAINGFVSQTQVGGYNCLDIYGVAPVASTQAANVSLFCKYAIVSHTYFTHSDARWKENIRSVSGLDVIDKIKARIYDWKDALQGKDQIGFIAQEVREHLPHCVYELPTDNPTDDPPLSVDYQAMSSFLWEVVRELRKEVANIKSLLDV